MDYFKKKTVFSKFVKLDKQKIFQIRITIGSKVKLIHLDKDCYIDIGIIKGSKGVIQDLKNK